MLALVMFTSSVCASVDQGWIKQEDDIANIRKMAGLSATGYNVMQGSCTDGNGMFYFSFMSKASEHIKIVKMQYVNDELVFIDKSDIVYANHGNDMAYVSNLGGITGNDKIFITNSYSSTNHITVFDVATMKEDESDIVCRYWKDYSECAFYEEGELLYDPEYLAELMEAHHGFSSIAYDKTNNRLVVHLASEHDIMTFRLEYNYGDITLVPTSYIIQDRIESTLQGIDCDSDYIYSCWSPLAGVSSYNIIYKYDWQGHLIQKHKIDKTYEIESLSHVPICDGVLFLAAYHHSYTHYYTTKEKVKVKKVWNKAHTKKIWKYKIVETKHCKIWRNAYVKKLEL